MQTRDHYIDAIRDRNFRDTTNKLLTIPFDWTACWILRADTLNKILSLITELWIYAVAFVKEQGVGITWDNKDTSLIAGISWYTFSPAGRGHNLGMHIDAIDRPESTELRGTILYSPPWSFSNIPTVFAPTGICDKMTQDFWYLQQLCERYPEVMDGVKTRVRKMIHDNSLWFMTSFQNIALALRNINTDENGEPRWRRDELTHQILLRSNGNDTWFITQAHQSSIIIFPNGIGWDRVISHGRFLSREKLREWNWKIINISVEWNGWLRGNLEQPWSLPEGIIYINGLTNTDRDNIVPS